MKMKKMVIGAAAVLSVLFSVGASAWAATEQQAAVEPPEVDRDLAREFAAGLAAMDRGDLNEAATHFRLVADRDPKSFEAHNNLAVIYADQGRNEEALAELRTVLKLRPEYYRGRKNLAELYARLAGQAFAEAAAVAPPEEREELRARAREFGAAELPAGPDAVAKAEAPQQGAPQGKTVAAVDAPAAAPAAVAPTPAPPPAVPFLALGDDGAFGLVIETAAVALYRQEGQAVRFVERFPAAVGGSVPQHQSWYVAKDVSDGIDLVPLAGRGQRLKIAKSGSGPTRVRVDGAALDRLSGAIKPFLTPVLAGPADGQSSAEEAALRATVAKGFAEWQASWSSKALRPYLDSYAPDYAPAGRSHQSWEEQRAQIFSKSGDVTVEQSAPVILQTAADEVTTLSQQRYSSELQVSSGVKSLRWIPAAGGWRIGDERMLSEKVESARR